MLSHKCSNTTRPSCSRSNARHLTRTLHHRKVVPVRASSDYDALKTCQVLSAKDGQEVKLLSLWEGQSNNPIVVVFMTHFADLSSWELAQKLKQKVLPRTQELGIPLVAVGLGEVAQAKQFSAILGFPETQLYADPTGSCYAALEFSPGFAPGLEVDPYLKLLPMLMGIGSPGTVQEVLRGYVGDRKSPPVFPGSSPFDILGKGYQRPFELATLRLQNMIGILPRWASLCPPDTNLLTQQGGCLVFDGDKVVYRHDDTGILKYVDVDKLLSVLEEMKPVPPAVVA